MKSNDLEMMSVILNADKTINTVYDNDPHDYKVTELDCEAVLGRYELKDMVAGVGVYQDRIEDILTRCEDPDFTVASYLVKDNEDDGSYQMVIMFFNQDRSAYLGRIFTDYDYLSAMMK